MTAKHRVGDFPLILIAGGASHRMGMPKGLLPIKGRPFLYWQLSRFRAAGGTRAIVVTGADAVAYRETLAVVAQAEEREIRRQDVCSGLAIRVVENASYELGPLSSLQKAIELYSESEYREALGAFFSPIDVPLPAPSVWTELASSFSMRRSVIKPTYKNRGGHPILMNDLFLQSLRDVDLDGEEARLDLQIRRLPAEQVLRCSVEERSVTLNLNTPEEFLRWVESSDHMD